ncbi:helix-turn-helix transcriptional regulator [Cesiribacter sp. SM1]|uniref:helix-turn-helix transcriptional regulator n=1 Tax=Cesiribacter sp. SM1 TaxID=2861196 RepID=UPI001CD7ABC6|nr:helix-turn-helix transcriptional regulator [Cesiribacter sp. SM1]
MHNKNIDAIDTGDLRSRIDSKIAEIAVVADCLPAVVIIHNIRTLSVEYMSPKGLKQLGLSLEEVKAMGTEYHTKFFNPEDNKEYVPKIVGLLERNNGDESISFFQQVRAAEAHAWEWHFSSVKILMRDDEDRPLLTITLASPVDPSQHETSKVERLLEEKNFFRINLQRFMQLSKRELDILRLLALGKSALETAKELSIADATVETHRKNIRKKLGVSSFYELGQYARAFDLI